MMWSATASFAEETTEHKPGKAFPREIVMEPCDGVPVQTKETVDIFSSECNFFKLSSVVVLFEKRQAGDGIRLYLPGDQEITRASE